MIWKLGIGRQITYDCPVYPKLAEVLSTFPLIPETWKRYMCWCELGMQFVPGNLLDRRSIPRRSIKIPHIIAQHYAHGASEVDSVLTSILTAVPGAEGEAFILYIARWDSRLG